MDNVNDKMAQLLEAVGKLIKARGRYHTEQNYKAVVEAYDAATHVTPPSSSTASEVDERADGALDAWDKWLRIRGPLGAGASPERIFFAGFYAGRRAALASNPATTTEGWQLAPAEPTPEMTKAAIKAAGEFRYNSTGMQGFTHADGYRAMLAAAPKFTPDRAAKPADSEAK